MNTIIRIALVSLGILATTAAVNFAPMISLKTPNMRQYRSHGMTVYAVPKDKAEVDRVAGRVARQSTRIVEALATENNEEISIIIYPNRKALHRKTIGLAGTLLPDWFIGDNTRDFVLVASPAHPGPAHTRESVEQAAVHEYVHVVTDRRDKQLGYWLKEGIALYLAEQRPQESAIRVHRDLTWEEFSNPSALQFAQVGGYTLAYTLIDYLIEHYGWEAVVGLTAPGATYESVLDATEPELFQGWMAQLQEI